MEIKTKFNIGDKVYYVCKGFGEVICPACKGRGHIDCSYKIDSTTKTATMTCPECWGKGDAVFYEYCVGYGSIDEIEVTITPDATHEDYYMDSSSSREIKSDWISFNKSEINEMCNKMTEESKQEAMKVLKIYNPQN